MSELDVFRLGPEHCDPYLTVWSELSPQHQKEILQDYHNPGEYETVEEKVRLYDELLSLAWSRDKRQEEEMLTATGRKLRGRWYGFSHRGRLKVWPHIQMTRKESNLAFAFRAQEANVVFKVPLGIAARILELLDEEVSRFEAKIAAAVDQENRHFMEGIAERYRSWNDALRKTIFQQLIKQNLV